MASPLAYLALMTLFLLAAEAAARILPFYRRETSLQNATRFHTLDGLRGFLAFGVFFHHARFSHTFYTDGRWDEPLGGFYKILGPLSVGMFFLITGFLFWSKAIAAHGRIHPLRLYANRARRIAPMYLASVAAVFAIAFALNRFALTTTPAHAARVAVSSLSLGLADLPKDPVAGVPIRQINAGVFWTLKWEWIFYFALPALAFCATPRRILILIAIHVVATAIQPHSDTLIFFRHFLLGMIAAQLVAARDWSRALRHPAVTLALLALSALPPFLLGIEHRATVTLMIAPIFLAIVYGNDLFGLLRTRGARLLGAASYSIYLLHGIVLFAVLNSTNAYVHLPTLSPLAYWTLIAAAGLATIALCTATYRFIEYPFLHPAQRAKNRPHPQPPTPQPNHERQEAAL